jgi:hypothetical protein
LITIEDVLDRKRDGLYSLHSGLNGSKRVSSRSRQTRIGGEIPTQSFYQPIQNVLKGIAPAMRIALTLHAKKNSSISKVSERWVRSEVILGEIKRPHIN